MVAFMGAVMGIGIVVVGILIAACVGLMAGVIWGCIVLAYTGFYMPPPINAASWWVGGLVLAIEIIYVLRQLWLDMKASDAYND